MNVLDQHHGRNFSVYKRRRVCWDFQTTASISRSTARRSSNLFVYSDSERDMGNASDDEEFLEHYKFLLRELYRATRPGRNSAVHCSDLPLTKWKDGRIGIKDLSGMIIRAHEECGWTLHSRITIWKCPVVEMTRTKAHGLFYKTLCKDSSRSRAGMPDYLLIFRKEGDNDRPISHNPDDFPVDLWQNGQARYGWTSTRLTRSTSERHARAKTKSTSALCSWI